MHERPTEPSVSGQSPEGVPRRERSNLLRARLGAERVTNVELFFDLVYVFAVTQLTLHLLQVPTPTGALQTLLLLAIVWLPWVYTTWLTNWLDPERLPVRATLLVLALASLVMSAALPQAFTTRGLAVGGAYAFMQIGRSVFAVGALRGQQLRRNYERILVWCIVSGALAILGGLVAGHAREACWAGAVAVDLTGGVVGFFVPGIGRSRTQEWTIDGAHFAERCQAFLLIALGESIVAIGTTLSASSAVTVREMAAFAVTSASTGALWWLYFDRSAELGAQILARSSDPGRLGRSAFGLTHPVMVAGIIVCAAGSERVIAHPTVSTGAVTTWMILGGAALFIAGHTAFKRLLWHAWPWSRMTAMVVLALLSLGTPELPAVLAAGFALAVVLGVALTDRPIARLTDSSSSEIAREATGRAGAAN